MLRGTAQAASGLAPFPVARLSYRGFLRRKDWGSPWPPDRPAEMRAWVLASSSSRNLRNASA